MAGQEHSGHGQLSRQVLEQVVGHTSEGIVLADARTDGLPVVYANPAYETLSGYTLEELTGTACPLLRTHSPDQPEMAKLQQAVGRAERCEVVVPDLRKDGTTWFSQVNVEPLYGSEGEVRYLLFRQKPAAPVETEATAMEVDLLQRELGRARQKIDSLNRIDSLTGVLRIEYFRELVQRDLGIARREGTGVALLMFDVQEFDAYRATFGSKAGESCLRMIGAQLNGTLRRSGDLSTRCAETTFAAFVRARDYEEAHAIAMRIQRNVRGLGLHNPRASGTRHVGVAVGLVAVVPGEGDDVDGLIMQARESIGRGTAQIPARVSG